MYGASIRRLKYSFDFFRYRLWSENVIRRFMVCLWALMAPIVSAQDLHTFSNGEVADAEKINENFQYLLENATGSSGCSAQQDGSSVVITCADGTSGVIAGAGTVVMVPEGSTSTTEPITYNTGDILILDANDVVLGVALAQIHDGTAAEAYIIEIMVNGFSVQPRLYPQESSQTVRLVPEFSGGYDEGAYWMTEDCSGPVWIVPRRQEIPNLFVNTGDGRYFVPAENSQKERLLMKSKIQTEGLGATGPYWYEASECLSDDFIVDAWRAVEYEPSQEIQSATMPLRLEQAP